MAKFKNVLLVEDDPITVMVCDKIIRNTDFAEDVQTCHNGAEALKYITDTSTVPDLIFLDLNMPVMNGWDFLQEFEGLKMDTAPRIFILSSSVDPEDIRKAGQFPIVENVISKPLTVEHLEKITA